MKRILLSISFLLGLTTLAAAQGLGGGCVGVDGINNVPIPGVTCASESNVNTYGASSIALVPASAATDIACISGSATQVVRVLSVKIGGTAGTAIATPVVLTKHASANSGGTAATSTALPVPYRVDSTDPAPTATTTAYTANPTINDATPGLIDAAIITFPVTTGGATSSQFSYLTHIYNEPPTLRGVAQQLCVNLNGATVSTGSLTISFLWTEQQS